jgi:hypothetical protein
MFNTLSTSSQLDTWPTCAAYTVRASIYSYSIMLKLILCVRGLLQMGKIILWTYAFLFALFSTHFIYMQSH